MLGGRTSLIVLAALTAGLVCAASAGATARPPVRNTTGPNINCGDTLTSKVVLSDNLDCSTSGATAVTLGAGGALDLGGHTLTVEAGNNGVYSTAANASITDGTINGGATAVNFQGAKGFVASGLTITGNSNGIQVVNATGAKITGNTITGLSYGIVAYTSTGTTISGNTTSMSVYRGIYTESDVKDIISGNTSTNDHDGIWANYSIQTAVSKNTVTTPGQFGIWFEDGVGNTATGNTITGSGSKNLYADSEVNDVFSGNTASNSTNANLEDDYSYNETWTKNTVTGGTDGMYMHSDDDGPYTVTNNTVTAATDYGIYLHENYYAQYLVSGPLGLVSGNTVKNTTRTGSGHSGSGFYDFYSVKQTFKGNTSTGNAYDGFYFDEPAVETITGNTASNNGDAGFWFDDNYAYYQTASLKVNKATGNGYYGFYAAYAQLGSGNSASGNAPFDCYQVQCASGSVGTTSRTDR